MHGAPGGLTSRRQAIGACPPGDVPARPPRSGRHREHLAIRRRDFSYRPRTDGVFAVSERRAGSGTSRIPDRLSQSGSILMKGGISCPIPAACRCCPCPTPSCSPAWSCRSSWTNRRRPPSTPPARPPVTRPTRRPDDTGPAGIGELLIAPRLADRYASYGVVATIEQVGRMAGGTPAAVLRAGRRARIGTGVSGPGAALWVQAELVDDEPVTDRARDAGRRVQVPGDRHPAEAGRVAGHRHRGEDDRPVRAGRRRRLGAVPDRGAEAGDPRDPRPGRHVSSCSSAGRDRTWPRWTSPRRSATTCATAWRRRSASSCCASSSPRSARSSARASRKAPRTTAPASRRPTCRTRSGRRPCARSAGWSGPATRARSPAGSAPGSTPCSRSRGTTPPRTTPTSPPPARFSTPTTTGSTTSRTGSWSTWRCAAGAPSRGLQVVGGRGSGAVLVLVGPPGVGKTSLGESVARALGRKFVRVALGGVRDEAEIRGHRRTYVGALPGRIVRGITEAGSMNPVMLLDEVDKVGADYRGDPAAALLEVLDPAQNHTFRDHYLDIDLDLSDVLFLATANVLDTIPSALLDRMELITMDGYTEDDKVAIARTHLLPRQLQRAALDDAEVTVTDAALHKIAADYTREAGVRQLERLLAKVFRKVATKLTRSDADRTAGRSSTSRTCASCWAGPGSPRRRRSAPLCPAWPPASRSPGSAATCCSSRPAPRLPSRPWPTAPSGARGLTLTGQLGDVMKESAQIALSYVRSHADRARHRPGGPRPADPPARAGRRGAEGRPVRRRHDGDRAGVAGARPQRAVRRGDDRRGDPERPGAADRRGQAEAAGRPARRASRRSSSRRATSPTSTTCPRRSSTSSRCTRWPTSARSSPWHWNPRPTRAVRTAA